MALIVNILKKIKEAGYVRFLNGQLLDKDDNVIDQIADPGEGEPGPGEPGISSILHIRYADDDLGNGFTDAQAGKAYAAWKIFSDPAYVPVKEDFTGNWFYRLGLPGNSVVVSTTDPADADGQPGWGWINKTTLMFFGPKTSASSGAWGTGIPMKGDTGPAGDKSGFKYKLGQSLVVDDPGNGWCRFSIDSFTAGATGFFSISGVTQAGQNIASAQLGWAVNDRITMQGNTSTNAAELIQLEITSREQMEAGLWHKYGFKVISSTNLSALTEFVIVHQKVFGLAEVLANKVARFDELGNLIDENGVKMSGIERGTMADLLAKVMADFDGEYFLVNGGVRNSGMRYRGTGTEAIADGEVYLYDDHPIFKCIFPNTQATAIANNGGKVQIAAAAHLLTTGNAVSVAEPVQVYISAWTGTGVAGWYKILSVDDANNYTIDLTYAAGLGTPTVALKNTQVATPISIPVPKLGNYSQINVEVLCQYTASTTGKSLFTRLNSTQFSLVNINATGMITASHKFGFRNVGAKNKQESLFVQNLGAETGQSTDDVVKMTEDTSLDSTISLRVNVVTANEVLCIRHVTVMRRW